MIRSVRINFAMLCALELKFYIINQLLSIVNLWPGTVGAAGMYPGTHRSYCNSAVYNGAGRLPHDHFA